MTRPAPYSTEVLAAISKGRHPDVLVFAGPDAHRRAERRRIECGPGSAMVLPDGEKPEAFAWPPVRPLAVISDETGPYHQTAILSAIIALSTSTRRDQ